MEKKYLPLYYEWLESGVLPGPGLCHIFQSDELFKLIDPDRGGLDFYWGYDGEQGCHGYINNYEKVERDFTPMRQNVVLFMAAMNNEL
jgi:hypothetical protein